MSNSWVCIDSNAATYLVEAIMTGKRPDDALAAEKISLLRTYLYSDVILCITLGVDVECSKIRDEERRKCHENLFKVLLDEALKPDMRELETRTSEYSQIHKGDRNRNDCRIIAEAELGGCEFLLTRDTTLIKKLDDRTHKIRLLTPEDFWSSLNIPCGSKSVRQPHPTNPLSQETWWIWQ